MVARCRHTGELINDFHNGCLVCTECGVALNEPVFGDSHVLADAAEAAAAFGRLEDQHGRLLREFLHDRLQPELDCTYFIDRIMAMLSRHRYRVARCPDLLRLSTARPIDRGVLAYFVWETLNVEGHPCVPQHVCGLLDANVRVLHGTERELGPSTVCSPGQYVARLGSVLGVPHPLRRLLSATADTYCKHLTHRPEIIVGGMLYHLLETRPGQVLDEVILSDSFIGPKYTQLARAAN